MGEVSQVSVPPLERVSFSLNVTVEESGMMFWKKKTTTVNTVTAIRGTTVIENLHKLCEEANKCPMEAFCFLAWTRDNHIGRLIEDITKDMFLMLLEELCPRHHYDYAQLEVLRRHGRSFHCVKPTARGPCPGEECEVVKLLKTFDQLNRTWKEMTDPASLCLKKPSERQFANKCTPEQMSPVTDFLSYVSSYYGSVVDAKRAEQRVTMKKRKLEEEKRKRDAQKVRSMEETPSSNNNKTNGHDQGNVVDDSSDGEEPKQTTPPPSAAVAPTLHAQN